MPPRYAYWTILAGGLPTAFRATHREELLPTFHRLREKHPDAEMKWFARGKLWASPEDAREASERARAEPRNDRRPRGRDWRPGGEHRDPRQPFKDAKQARNQRWRQRKFERKRAAGPDTWRPRDERVENRPPFSGRREGDRPGARDGRTKKFTSRPRNDRQRHGQANGHRREERWKSPPPEQPHEERARPKSDTRHADARPPKPRPFERGGFDRNQRSQRSGPPHHGRPPSHGKKRHR